MNIFEYEGKEFDKKLDEIFKNINKENLKRELIECGLEIKRTIAEEQLYKLKQEPLNMEREYKTIKDLTIIKQEYNSIQKPILKEKQYTTIQEYKQCNYFNVFDIHTNSTSNSIIHKLLKKKMEIGDVA